MSTRKSLVMLPMLVLALLCGCSTSTTPGSAPSSGGGSSSSAPLTDGQEGPLGDTYAARQMRASIACLREAGWDVRYDPASNTFGGTVPPEQQDAYLSAQEACDADFEAANPVRKLTDADFRELYRQELVTVKCLEKEGYPPNGNPISEQQYVDEYRTQGFPSWQAYRAVNIASAEDLAALEKKCPQPFVDQEQAK